MRERKYKVLDKEDNQVYDVTDLHLRGGIVSYNYTPLKDDFGLVIEKKISEVILLDYTGFNDPNGVEIYEHFIMDNGCVACYDSRQGKWKAIPFSTYLCNAGLGGWTGYDLYSHVGKVIGNAFENPDLLEEPTAK